MTMRGQPDNTSGFDACVPLGRYIGGLKAAGVDFVGRYIAAGAANAWKVMTPTEAVELAIAGMPVFPIYETNGRPSGTSIGMSDGAFAAIYLPKIGLLPGTGVVVEYTEDKDTQPSEISGIAAAFAAFGKMLAPSYDIGSYGGGYCNAEMAKRGLIKIKWLTCSQGFNGTKQAIAAGDYDVIQRVPTNVTINGAVINIDPDSLHVASADIGARVPWNGAVPKGAPLSATSIQMLLNNAGQQPPLGVDDVSGAGTNAALKAWLAKAGFSSLAWGGAVEALLAAAGVPIYQPVAA